MTTVAPGTFSRSGWKCWNSWSVRDVLVGVVHHGGALEVVDLDDLDLQVEGAPAAHGSESAYPATPGHFDNPNACAA